MKMTITRWVRSRKLEVVNAIKEGRLTRLQACSMWDLSDEELQGWIDVAESKDRHALKVTHLTKMRRRLQRLKEKV